MAFGVRRSLTSYESSDSDSMMEVPLDKLITRDDLRVVQQFLEKVSIEWYNIGWHLGVPKDKLDLIEQDHRDTARRLLEMIDVWINAGGACTWGALVRALKDSGHRETANKVIAKTSEVDVKAKEHLSRIHRWEEKEAAVCRHKESFQLKLQLTNHSYQKFTSSLREVLSVPDTVEDTAMLSNIDTYADVSYNFLYKSVGLKKSFMNVTEHLQTAQEHLHVWVSMLIKDMDMVCDKLKTLTIQKEEEKDKLFLLALKSSHTEHDRLERDKCDRQVKKVDQKMKEAYAHWGFLSWDLNSSLDYVQSIESRNKSLIVARNLAEKVLKSMGLTSIFLGLLVVCGLHSCLMFGLFDFLLFPEPLHLLHGPLDPLGFQRLFNVLVLLGLRTSVLWPFAAAVVIIKCFSSNYVLIIKKATRRTLFYLTLRGKLRRTLVSVLAGMASALLLVTTMNQTGVALYTCTAFFACTAINNMIMVELIAIAGAIVIRSLIWRIHLPRGHGIAVFVYYTLSALSFIINIDFALAGVLIGIIVGVVVDKEFFVTFVSSIVFFCFIFTLFIGSLLAAHFAGTVGTAIASTFITFFFLLWVSYTRIFPILSKLADPANCLHENFQKLKLIGKDIRKVLNKAQPLKETLPQFSNL